MGIDPNQAKSIFLSAVEDRPPEQWSGYLDEACRGNAELRQRVEVLLAAHQGTDRLFDDPAAALMASADLTEPTEAPGAVIGRYKLLEKIGEGGMAVVYMAEQEQPIRRKVALKIIKLGMDTRQVIARFEAERQALALMDHPSIAKVLDAGATETGRPYFVMELVTGVSITEYCDKDNLSTKDRLVLFLQVCNAVQHAHQKGIIHRDIKPSNVMVTHHDGKPVPKVIDFGIAKATNQRLTEKTLFTRYAHIIGTPAYMSPEQAELSDLDIDTRTDIYSLGVLLYELLTGTTPFSEEELRKAGYIEMQRVIRGREPAKPSTKLGTLGETLTEIAKDHGCTPDLLRKTVRGDLDWIVMTCLEKDRAHRYETAHALGEDIRRYFRHEPIIAGSHGVIYRARKYVRRHRYQTVGAAFLAVSLGALALGSALYYRSTKLRWAKEEALPILTKLADQKDYLAAHFLATKVAEIIPDDPAINELWSGISRSFSLHTRPPGSDVYYRSYVDLDGDWLYLGRSPLEETQFPKGVYRWRIVKEGFEPRECVCGVSFETTLQKTTEYPEMVLISSGDLGSYLMDRCEVTNEEFEHFVRAGGYENPEYWKHPFLREGQELSWETAITQFLDETGHLGPATWRDGTYPEGRGMHPVSGISWFEASAYAEFAGKGLPTVAHWRNAAPVSEAALIAPYSNFGGGPAPVGSHRGVGRHGLYDTAGNVREWCFNTVGDSPDRRYILGGSWMDAEYMFSLLDTCSAWDRSARNGFRCANYMGCAGSLPLPVFDPPEGRTPRDLSDVSPLTDEEFRACRELYSYDRTELEPQAELLDSGRSLWRREKITFNAAYGTDRVTAYLFLPVGYEAPFQPIVFFPSINALTGTPGENLRDTWAFEYIVRSGRAVLYPIYKGTYERHLERGRPDPDVTPIAFRNWFVQMYQDLARAVDYLESRGDMDADKLAYLGLSWGAGNGPLFTALENRIRFAVFVNGGCFVWRDYYPSGTDAAKFAHHVKVPTGMFNGMDDTFFPYEASQRRMYERLGTPPEQKVHKTYPGGHGARERAGEQLRQDVLDWLNKYLGPPNKLDGKGRNGE